MTKNPETFFTEVGCMDGRVQDVVKEYGQKKFGSRYSDTITEAGLVGILSKEQVDPKLVESLQFKIVTVSLGKHAANGIVVHGHAECAGNPVPDEKHRDDIRRSVQFIEKLVGNAVPVVGVFVKRSGSGWTVEEL